ncbi:MAG: hypothetical protein LBU32_19310 [Clostridiales bacterium]|nr:hypothetical protein [Clostridiales bacterium]
MTVMTDADAPLPFVEAVVGDRALLSREKRPLKRMKARITGREPVEAETVD